jgi:hypothetical protein
MYEGEYLYKKINKRKGIKIQLLIDSLLYCIKIVAQKHKNSCTTGKVAETYPRSVVELPAH